MKTIIIYTLIIFGWGIVHPGFTEDAPSYIITGRLINDQGNSLRGVQVYLYKDNPSDYSAEFTDDHGYFIFCRLGSGTYNLSTEHHRDFVSVKRENLIIDEKTTALLPPFRILNLGELLLPSKEACKAIKINNGIEHDYAIVSGRLINQYCMPLPGASVFLTSDANNTIIANSFTNKHGYFEFPLYTPGSYSFHARLFCVKLVKQNFIAIQGKEHKNVGILVMNVAQPANAKESVPLTSYAYHIDTADSQNEYEGEIKGTTIDEGNTPLPGVTITFHSAKGEKYIAITDADGHFLVTCLPPDMYTIRGELSPFSSFVKYNIQLNSHSSIDLGTLLMIFNPYATLDDGFGCGPIIYFDLFDFSFLASNYFFKSLPVQRNFISMLCAYPGASCNRQ